RDKRLIMTRYQVNPEVIIYQSTLPAPPKVLIETFTSTPPLIVDDPRLPWSLGVLPAEFSKQEAACRWDGVLAGEEAEQLFAFCLTNTLILQSRGDAEVTGNWPRSAYHTATRNHPFLDMATGFGASVEDNRIMQSYLEESPSPNVYLEPSYEETL